MPLKARSTTGRVWPEHVSGVCFIAMAPVGRERRRSNEKGEAGRVKGRQRSPTATRAAWPPGDGTEGTGGRKWEGRGKREE